MKAKKMGVWLFDAIVFVVIAIYRSAVGHTDDHYLVGDRWYDVYYMGSSTTTVYDEPFFIVCMIIMAIYLLVSLVERIRDIDGISIVLKVVAYIAAFVSVVYMYSGEGDFVFVLIAGFISLGLDVSLSEQAKKISEEEKQEKEEQKRLAKELKKQQNEKTNKKRRVIAISVTSVIALITTIVLLLVNVVIPTNQYNQAIELKENEKYSEAIEIFINIIDKKDSKSQLQECHYFLAEDYMSQNNICAAAINFGKAGDYKDAATRSNGLWDIVAVRETISANNFSTFGLKVDGTVVSNSGFDINNLTNIVAVSAGYGHVVALKSNGIVVATGNNFDGQCNVSTWTDIVAISASPHDFTIGLRKDGHVVATGINDNGQCDVYSWTDVVSISTGSDHTVALRADGTVVATGNNDYGQCNVSTWTDIIAISAGFEHTVGLKADGTVVAVGKSKSGACEVDGWSGIIAISAGGSHTVGLKSDGTVVATNYLGYEKYDYGQCDVNSWKNIIAISAGASHTVGLKADGTVVAVGDNEYGACNVNDWKNIKTPGN